MPPGDSLVAAAFGKIRRFHVYDHRRDDWVMSGADFSGDSDCVVEHNFDPGELTTLDRPDVLVEGSENLTLVWEDGCDDAIEENVVDQGTAEIAARAVIDELSEHLDVEQRRIRLVALEAPNQVRYFVTGPSADEVYDE